MDGLRGSDPYLPCESGLEAKERLAGSFERSKGLAKSIAALEKLEKRGAVQSSVQAGRLQRQVRELSTERRQIVKMLNTLGHSYPCDHQRTHRPRGGGDQR